MTNFSTQLISTLTSWISEECGQKPRPIQREKWWKTSTVIICSIAARYYTTLSGRSGIQFCHLIYLYFLSFIFCCGRLWFCCCIVVVFYLEYMYISDGNEYPKPGFFLLFCQPGTQQCKQAVDFTKFLHEFIHEKV